MAVLFEIWRVSQLIPHFYAAIAKPIADVSWENTSAEIWDSTTLLESDVLTNNVDVSINFWGAQWCMKLRDVVHDFDFDLVSLG